MFLSYKFIKKKTSEVLLVIGGFFRAPGVCHIIEQQPLASCYYRAGLCGGVNYPIIQL
jgi:hypothetical protein